VAQIRESGAFDGVHLIPVARYREVAAQLEQQFRAAPPAPATSV
jgi:methylenetetrahydrofolate reductase (NADPH)